MRVPGEYCRRGGRDIISFLDLFLLAFAALSRLAVGPLYSPREQNGLLELRERRGGGREGGLSGELR